MDRIINKLITHFGNFAEERYSDEEKHKIEKLVEEGQKPPVFVICCCDSRSGPEVLFQSDLGDMFVQRHIAAYVPPHQFHEHNYSISAAIEFAVDALKVKHIIVMGHTSCGGVACLCQESYKKDSNIARWVTQAKLPLELVRQKHQDASEDQLISIMEKETVKWSLENLKEYPSVIQAIQERGLQIHGWQYDLKEGIIHAYDADQDRFTELTA